MSFLVAMDTSILLKERVERTERGERGEKGRERERERERGRGKELNTINYIINLFQLTVGGNIVKLKYIQHPLVSIGRFCNFFMADRGENPSLIGIVSTM